MAQDPDSCPGLVGAGLQALESLSADVKSDLTCDSAWKLAVQAVATYSKNSKGSRSTSNTLLPQHFTPKKIPIKSTHSHSLAEVG